MPFFISTNAKTVSPKLINFSRSLYTSYLKVMRFEGISSTITLMVSRSSYLAGRMNFDLFSATGIITPCPMDLRKASIKDFPGAFDRVLVDAPCSATGVIRRHPDVKVLRRASDIEGLAAAQGAILGGLWPLLKPGGVLLYATCSILREENSQVVERFAAEHPEAPVIFISGYPKGADVEELLESGALGFLDKPCSQAELSRALAEAALASASERISA